MVDTSRWWMMKRPVAAVGFVTTAMGATPDEGHKYIRRLRALTVKHMGHGGTVGGPSDATAR